MSVLSVAQSQIGRLAKVYIQHWGRSKPEAWCADFAGYCVDTAGQQLARPFWGNVGDLNRRLAGHGWPKSGTPHAGDVFCTAGNMHTGVVESVQPGKMTTIEGNTQTGNDWDNEQVRRIVRTNWTGWTFLTPPGHTPAPAPAPAPATVPDHDELARQVIAGHWGAGQDRVNRLTAAGHDAAAVQTKVNQTLAAATPPLAPDIDRLARDVIAGRYGNGAARQQALGGNYTAVQARVNEILKGR